MAFNLAGAAAGVEIASGIKGLFGGGSSPIKQMKTQLSYDRQKYLAMSEGARNAGFNPLTVLQAGGANTGFTASAGGPPPLASAEILSGGLRDLNDELSGENDRRRAANQLEQELAQVKLDTMRAALAGPSAADAVGLGPSTVGRRAATVAQRNVVPAGGQSGSDIRLADPVALLDGSAGGIAVPDGRLDRGTGSYVAGRRLDAAPGWSPASVIEEEYGDVGSWVYGGAKFLADANHTFNRGPGQTRGTPLEYNSDAMPPGAAKDAAKRSEARSRATRRYLPGFGLNPWFGFSTQSKP